MDYYTPAKLTNSMMQIIENGDLGKAPQQVVQAMQSLQRLGCVFFTQNCVKPNRPELVTAAQTKVCLCPGLCPTSVSEHDTSKPANTYQNGDP